MAIVNITTTAAQDAAAQRYVIQYNNIQRMTNPGWVDVTAVQWAKSLIFDRLNALVAQYTADDTLSKAELYQKATAADQAAIDAILAKYS